MPNEASGWQKVSSFDFIPAKIIRYRAIARFEAPTRDSYLGREAGGRED